MAGLLLFCIVIHFTIQHAVIVTAIGHFVIVTAFNGFVPLVGSISNLHLQNSPHEPNFQDQGDSHLPGPDPSQSSEPHNSPLGWAAQPQNFSSVGHLFLPLDRHHHCPPRLDLSRRSSWRVKRRAGHLWADVLWPTVYRWRSWHSFHARQNYPRQLWPAGRGRKFRLFTLHYKKQAIFQHCTRIMA